MSRLTRFPALCLVGLLWLLLSASAREKEGANVNWPSFRGVNASGISEGFPLASDWDLAAPKNVLWQTRIPELGLSSPVIWAGRVYLTTAISGQDKPQLKTGLYGDIASVQDETAHRWMIYCLDKRTGKMIWEKQLHTGVPKVKRHPKSTHANTTLATDGRHLVAFLGSEGLYCLDMDGKLLWKKDFGLLDSAFYVAPAAQWEFASSPIIYQDKVLVQCDVLKGSFVAALNIKDGTEAWRTSRDDVPTWSTPAVYDGGTTPQMIVNGYRHAGGYDLKTGREIWRLQGGGDIPVPTPVIAHEMVFITSAHGKLAPIYAIRLNASGDISLQGEATSNEFVAWSYPRDGAYMSTPLVYGDHIYSCKINGVLLCYDARTGNRLYQERLGSGATGFTASPVAGDGKLYFPSEEGDVYVVKAGPKFELIAKNALGEACMASPAISEGVLYFRTRNQVIAVSAGR